MAQFDSEQLKKSFHQEMIALYKRMTKELKYKSPRLMDLINKYGGYEAAVKYITTENNVQDFAVLWENERLDLSVEALITNARYRELFMDDIVKYCDRKLEEYSYAPNKIEEIEEEPITFYEEEPLFPKVENLTELVAQEKKIEENSEPYISYSKGIPITESMWQEVLQNTHLVSKKNLDLLLRIYFIGDRVTPEELSKEDGYLATYPYNEVMTAMAKRIKAYLKVEVPLDEDGKVLWWHLLFVGGVKDNKCFEWSLRSNLRKAIKTLIEEDKVQTTDIVVHTQKPILDFQEEPVEEVVEENVENQDISDFDRLFEAIMMPKAENNCKKVDIVEKNKEESISPTKSELSLNTCLDKEDKEISQSFATKVNVVQQAQEEFGSDTSETQEIEVIHNKTLKELKAECIRYYGAICDICGFDYGYTYGEAYEMEIEVHNIKGILGEEILADTHPIEDLIPICHNCHHILHHHQPMLSVEKMRQMVKV